MTQDPDSQVPGRRPQKPAARRSGASQGGHGATPEAKRDAVMVALLRGLSCDAAGAACDVNGRTVRDWMQSGQPFRLEYDERRAAINARSDEALANARTVAVDALVALSMAGDGQAAAALLRATTAARVETSGPGGGPIVVAKAPSLDEMQQVRDALDAEIARAKGSG